MVKACRPGAKKIIQVKKREATDRQRKSKRGKKACLYENVHKDYVQNNRATLAQSHLVLRYKV